MSSSFGRAAVFRSALLVTGSTYFSYAAILLMTVVVARSLGPHEYGLYAYFVWLTGTLILLYCNGITTASIRFISECIGGGGEDDAKNTHRLFGKWFLTGIVLTSALFLVAFPYLAPADWSGPIGWIAVAALVAAIGKSIYLFNGSIGKGYGHFEIDAYSANVMSALTLAFGLALASVHASLNSYIALFVVSCIGHAVIAQVLTRRAGIVVGTGEVPPVLREKITKHYFWTTILFLSFALSNKTIETLFLNAYVGPAAVGWFAISAALTRGGADMLASGLTTVLMPAMAHAFGSKDLHRAKRIFTEGVRYYFFLGLLLAGIGFLWARPAILLFFGEAYMPAVIGLQVMMLVGGLALPEGAIASLLATSDHQYVRVVLSAGYFLITLVLAILFIPAFGFEGALAAHATARMTGFVVSVVIISRLLQFHLPYIELLRMVAAAGVGLLLALGVLLVSDSLQAHVVAGLAYCAGCIAGSLMFRVWTTSDVSTFQVVSNRLPTLKPIERALAGIARPAN